MWSKNFAKRPYRRIVTPRGSEQIRLTLTPFHIIMLLLVHRNQPPNGILIGLAVFAYTATNAPNAFQWVGQPLKLPFFGDQGLI